MEIVQKIFEERVDNRGKLVFLEGEHDIPFPIRRVYYIHSTRDGARRGFHAHKTLWQCLICVHGNCTIMMDDGDDRQDILLDDPRKGLLVGPGIWREMYDFSDNAVLLVLASDIYCEDDYIRDYREFLEHYRKT